jgi:hypothetical protein
MEATMDGFYSVYFTGLVGSGFGLLMIKGGKIIGADTEGVLYDGSYFLTKNGLVGSVIFKAPPNVHLVTGPKSGEEGLEMAIDLNLPKNFGNGQTLRIDTPNGPVNAIFRKLRDA